MAPAADEARARNRAVWEAGDWDTVAAYIAEAGPRLLDSIGAIGPDVRLLDVATGNGGSVAIPAAVRGAQVTGCDLAEQWLTAARRHAGEAGVEVEWVVADAADLPFADASFDVVTSTFGHMFAPDQAAAARELVRVCRPGGTIGLCCWTPDGPAAKLFSVLGDYTPPPPPGFQPPVLWGDESHVSALLEPLGVTLELRRKVLTLRFASTEKWMELYEENFGPIVTAKAFLGDRWPEVRAEILELARSIDHGDEGGAMAHEYEYLETIGRVAGGE
jgi:SAM-dependent methyltransferase